MLRIALAAGVALVLLLSVVVGSYVLASSGDSRDGRAAAGADVGDCIRVAAGMVSAVVPCSNPNDGVVARVITRSDACPAGERRVDQRDGSRAVCLTPNG